MLRLLFLLFLAIGASWSGLLRAEVIRVDDVEVEITAKNPVEARERAFLEARRTGYRIALEASGQTIPARVTDEAVNAAVVAIEVQSERQSGDRYSARFSLFVETPDSGARANGAAPSPSLSSSPPPPPAADPTGKRGAWIYVIPAERSEGRIDRIWRRDTAWTQSFRAVSPIAGQSPLTPSGDDDDRALVAPARLAVNDAGALAALSQRHGAPVAAAILERGPPTRAGRSDGPITGVEVLYWSRTGGAQSLRHGFTEKTEIATANAIAQALLEQIVAPIAPMPPPPPPQPTPPPVVAAPPASAITPPLVMEQPAPAPAERPAEEHGPEIQRPFAFDLTGIDEWRRVRARLGAIPGLTILPSTITTGRVIGQFRYAGTPEALTAQLSAAGLDKAAPGAPRPSSPPPAPQAPSVASVVAPPPAPPGPAFPTAAPEAEGGSYAAHLVSTRSEGEAKEEWSRLSQRYPELMAGHGPIYRSVDLGPDRGVWWRLGVAGFANRRDADAWCAKLAAFNQYCRVAAN